MDPLSAKLIFISIILLSLFVLFVYWIFNFIILYHLTRFGIGTQPKKFAAVFLLGSIGLFLISVLLFANIDINSLKHKLEKFGNSMFDLIYSK